MRTWKVLGVGLMAAVMLSAADPTGKWEATVQTPQGEGKMTFNLKADGEKLTGTVSNPRMGESEIQDGKISGDELTFKQVMERGDRKMSVEWTGKMAGGEITFTRKLSGGRPGGPGRPGGSGGGQGGGPGGGQGGGPGGGQGGGPGGGPGGNRPVVAKRVK